jgi:hypothetical protein
MATALVCCHVPERLILGGFSPIIIGAISTAREGFKADGIVGGGTAGEGTTSEGLLGEGISGEGILGEGSLGEILRGEGPRSGELVTDKGGDSAGGELDSPCLNQFRFFVRGGYGVLR